MISEAQYRSIEAEVAATPVKGRQIADMISGSHYVAMNECDHWPLKNAELCNCLQVGFLKNRLSSTELG